MTDIFAALGLPPPGSVPPPVPALPPLPPEYEAWVASHPAPDQAQARDTANAKYAEYLAAQASAPVDVCQRVPPPEPVVEVVPPPEPTPTEPGRGRPPKGEALQIILAAAPGSRTVSEIRELIELAQESK
jgi:hypothetical protein